VPSSNIKKEQNRTLAHRRCGALGAALLGIVLFCSTDWASESISIKLADGTDVVTTVHSAKGNNLILWLLTGYDPQPGETRVAIELANAGLDVWQPRLLEARWLPELESNLAQVPAEDVAQLIDRAHRDTGKSVYLLGASHAAMLALRGAQVWQMQHRQGTALAGAVLLYPNLFIGPPAPGKEAVYHALVRQTRLPIFIIQPALSPWHWSVAQTQAVLESGGSKVYVRTVSNTRTRFHFRLDATEQEEREAKNLPRYLRQAIAQLAQVQLPAQPPTVTTASHPAQPATGKRGLNPYTADPTPSTLLLPDLEGRMHDLSDYRGRVVLVNFWASWCPPCVHEMPSLQRLKHKLSGQPFTILAINMAEDDRIVRTFLRDKVRVDFTVLLDADGETLKRWKVFVFPTSFVIGPDGSIRYGAYGELPWDEEPALGIIQALLPKK
jgi:thiol-disulfide isomerase/thioredoxin